MILKKANITFLVDRNNRTTIDIRDCESCITFVSVELTNDQLASALSRLGDTPCEKVEVYGFDKIGKKMERKQLEVEIPKGINSDRNSGDKLILHQCVDKACPDGWESDHYYNSQGSFFTKNDNHYCRVTIRRYV